MEFGITFFLHMVKTGHNDPSGLLLIDGFVKQARRPVWILPILTLPFEARKRSALNRVLRNCSS